MRTTTNAQRAKDPSKVPFKLDEADYGIIGAIDDYKTRKEPLPFGMSEKIWDLESYKPNFENFKNFFNEVKQDYESGERRIR